MVLLTGVVILRNRAPTVVPQESGMVEIVRGSAVGDLQMLGEIDDASGGSDLLDELATEKEDIAKRN